MLLLDCNGIRERKKIVELWSGVAQYCLLVGNYNSATAILETLESPPIARLKVTWSKLSSTCQQLDCMQRHAEGYVDLWTKQAIVLNENQKTDPTAVVVVVSSTSTAATTSASSSSSATTATASASITAIAAPSAATSAATTTAATVAATTVTTTSSTSSSSERKTTKPNDWVVIPVFADIVKLAISGREDCLQRLPNGHINVTAFDRMAAIAGAFTKHMSAVKAPPSPDTTPGEYEAFCRHMHKTSTLNESELMMASFDCEEPNNAEKLMYDLN